MPYVHTTCPELGTFLTSAQGGLSPLTRRGDGASEEGSHLLTVTQVQRCLDLSQARGPCWAHVSPTPAQTPCGVHTEWAPQDTWASMYIVGEAPQNPPHAGQKERRYPTTTLGALQAAQAEATARICSQKPPTSPSSPRKGRVTSVIHLGCQQAQYFRPPHSSGESACFPALLLPDPGTTHRPGL